MTYIRKTPKQAIRSAVRKTVKNQLGGSKRKRGGKGFIRREKKLTRRNRADFFLAPKFFKRPQLLSNFEGSFELKICTLYAPNGPLLEFEVKGDRTNFVNLQNICLDIECKIVKVDNTLLNHVTGDAKQQDTPVFVNNNLHSLLSD